jgi:hypothetical protein
MSHMTWSEMFPDPLGTDLRRVIQRALVEVYDENIRRYAPEDLGDNNITFGVNVSQNLRFLIERDVADLDSVEVERPRNSFILRVGRSMIHFYKAPPAVFDITALTFDESELKLELRQENAAQLSFDFTDGWSTSRALPSHVVVVHFGDPLGGFEHAEVGAPYSTATGGCDWAWHERFDIDEDIDDSSAEPMEPEPKVGPGFGLQLRESREAADDEAAESADEP